MKKEKSNKPDPQWGSNLTPAQREARIKAFLKRTRPENIFPEGYRRAYENLLKAGLI